MLLGRFIPGLITAEVTFTVISCGADRPQSIVQRLSMVKLTGYGKGVECVSKC